MNAQDLKDYLRLDSGEQDGLIETIASAADLFLKNSGCVAAGNEDLYNLAQTILAAHWYENPGLIGKGDELPYTFSAIVTQLKYCGDVV